MTKVTGAATNVVLFHKSSSVQPLTLPEGTKVSTRSGFGTEDGWEFDFGVHEEVSSAKPQQPETAGFPHLAGYPDIAPWPNPPVTRRADSLKVNLSSVRVHAVKAVSFTTDDYPVARHRFQAREADF